MQVLQVVLCLMAFALVPVTVQGQDQPRFAPDAEIRDAFRKVIDSSRASVVQLLVDGEGRAIGTIVDPDGYVLSKASELQGDVIQALLPAGRAVDAELVGIDRKNDLAMLKVDATGLVAATFVEGELGLGRMVACVGVGHAPEAVGVISAKARPVKPAQLVLGVILRAHPDGLWVDEVRAGFGAAGAGMKQGDVLTHVDGQQVVAVDQVVGRLQGFAEGDEVEIQVLRGGEVKRLAVVLSAFGPDPRSRIERMNQMGGELSDRRRGFELVLQHDAELKPMHCGGPLVNLDGEVVGLNIARAGRIASYALPSSLIRGKLAALKSGRLVPDASGARSESVVE